MNQGRREGETERAECEEEIPQLLGCLLSEGKIQTALPTLSERIALGSRAERPKCVWGWMTAG